MRLLKANEIEVRVGSCKENGCSLLLYKNARVDMQLMDEEFGSLNWKREHVVINKNNYCRVSVYNKDIGEWISKEDCGVESYTEKQKGESSDAFKRACVNWGIGRELYTSPFIWVKNVEIKPKAQGFTTYDKFYVQGIDYNDKREISNLIITNQYNIVVYKMCGKITTQKEPKKKILTDKQIARAYAIANSKKIDENGVKQWIEKRFNKKSLSEITKKEYDDLCDALEKIEIKQ